MGWEGFEAWRQIPSFPCQGHMAPAPAHWASSCWGTAEHFHLMDTEAEQINPRHGKMRPSWGGVFLAAGTSFASPWLSHGYLRLFGVQTIPASSTQACVHPPIRYLLKACLVLGAGLVLVKPSRQKHSNALEQGCQV